MRKPYWDNLRWGTVAMVVFYHVIYLFNGVVEAGVVGPFRETQAQDAILYVLYPWFMLLLFVVSGASARLALEKVSGRAFFRARTVKLLVPSTVGLLVFHWIQGLVSMRMSGAFETMPDALPLPMLYLIAALSGTGVLWYIQMLWLFSGLLLLIRKVEKGRLLALGKKTNVWILTLMGVAVWGAAQILNTPVIAVYRFGIYGLGFFLGYFVFSHEAVTDRLAKAAPLFFLPAAALMVANVALYFGQNYAVSPVVNSPLSIAYAWLTCLALIGSMKRWGNRTGPFCDFMRRKSWGLYVFHYLPMSVCGLLLTEYTSLPPVLIYGITAVAAFGGALALYELLSRIPVLRWCVLGIRKGESHVYGEPDPTAKAA